jgi:hypothetical protein
VLASIKSPVRLVVAALAATMAVIGGPAAGAASLPSGEVSIGNFPTGGSVLEPAYNDADGSMIYLSTPAGPAVHPNSHNVAPLYVIVYPTSAAGAIGTVNCQHQPADNCPDHGPTVAAVAKGLTPFDPGEPGVYGGGVWGHDHILAAPASGGDFNIIWLPIAVLFTNSAAAKEHITTLAALRAAEARGDAREIPLPPATFHCGVVAAAVYNHGTPLPPAPPLP